MTRLVLIRHGHVEGIDPERFRGRRDVPLSELGKRQAVATAERVAAAWRPSAIFTSPLQRCRQTAEAIAAPLGLRPEPLEALVDLDYGEWTWKTHAEAKAADGGRFQQWFTTPELVRFPDGESLQDLVARTADVLRRLLDDHLLETVAVVGHDSVNRAILLQALQQPLCAYWRLAQAPCGINEIQLDHHRAQVVRMNETAHLDGLAGG